MASGLRAKLNRMKTAESAAPARRSGGLICRVSRVDLDEAIYDLPPVGLRRIGWTGSRFDIRRCLFLDTETTGLSHGAGTVAFLVGLGWVEERELVVEQMLMREYADEPELIERLAERMARFDCVCTFNGKTFDMPLLEARFTMCRMREKWREMENLDLLTPSRRAWKLRLGSCRLSNLEAEILGKPRTDDLPGSEVPARYFEYMKTGNEALLGDIVDHNCQDIATLATLLIELCRINDQPQSLTDRRDLFSLGKSLEKQGELGPARELYRVAAIPRPAGTLAALGGERVAGMANWRGYLLCRKSRDWEGARDLLLQMLNRRQMPGTACTELAKLLEHRFKQYRQALEYALKSQNYPDGEPPEAHRKRVERLRRRIDEQPDRASDAKRGLPETLGHGKNRNEGERHHGNL